MTVGLACAATRMVLDLREENEVRSSASIVVWPTSGTIPEFQLSSAAISDPSYFELSDSAVTYGA